MRQKTCPFSLTERKMQTHDLQPCLPPCKKQENDGFKKIITIKNDNILLESNIFVNFAKRISSILDIEPPWPLT